MSSGLHADYSLPFKQDVGKMMILKAILVWVIIAIGETANGIFRVHYLNRKMSSRRARQIALISGSFLILCIGWLAVPWIGPETDPECLLLGLIWLLLMLAYDLAVGRFVFHYSWGRIAADFDLRKGNFLAIGMLVLFLTPLLVMKLQSGGLQPHFN